MSSRVGGQPPPAVSRPTATSTAKADAPVATPPPPQKKADSDYQSKQKKPVNMTGAFKPVAKAQPKVDPELAKLVGNLRTAVNGGGAAATKATVAATLKKIGNDANKVGDELKKLSPDQRKAVWDALPAKVKEAAGKSPNAAIAMLQVQSMSDAQLKSAAADMRSGKITNQSMQLSIATELAARTKWGKDDPHQVELQREMVVSGKVSFLDGRGAARTTTEGVITLDSKLAKSPEALAATLAHEGTHAAHANGWGMMATYAEETSGNLASAQVWGEIGNPSDPDISTDMRDGLNDYAAQFKAFGEDGVQARVAAEYVSEASKRNNAAERVKVREVISDLKADPGALKAMKAEYALEIAKGLLRIDQDQASVKDLGKAFQNLPANVRTELDGLLKEHGFDDDTRKALVDAMNGK